MAELTTKKREEIEALIYTVLDAMDPTKTNSEHYQQMFGKMSNQQFKAFFSKTKYPLRFHIKQFEAEPTMDGINKACNLLNIKLMEKIKLRHLYTNSNGTPVATRYEAYVVPIHLKKVQQIVTKKNGMSTDAETRDMKTGLLIGHDKNGITSDREMGSLAILGLDKTFRELSTVRADYMAPKNAMNAMINTTGQFKLSDIDITPVDSLSKNLMNVYMLGAMLETNIVNSDGYLPYTLKNKQRQVKRQ